VDVGIIAAVAFVVDFVDAAFVGAAGEMLAVSLAALILAIRVDAADVTARSLLGFLDLDQLPSGGLGIGGAPRDADDGVVKAKGAHRICRGKAGVGKEEWREHRGEYLVCC